MDIITKNAIRTIVEEQVKNADAEGRRRYGARRLITFKQEIVFRLVHHDHFGLSIADTAKVAGTTERDIAQKLIRLAVVAPQLLPILTPLQAKIYRMFIEGYTTVEIAEFFRVTERRIRRVLTLLHDSKQVFFRSDAGRYLRYRPSMDQYVTEKF